MNTHAQKKNPKRAEVSWFLSLVISSKLGKLGLNSDTNIIFSKNSNGLNEHKVPKIYKLHYSVVRGGGVYGRHTALIHLYLL